MSQIRPPLRPLVLASASPRRRALLSTLGRPFDVQVADVDERPLPGEDPATYGLRLALSKAQTVAAALAAAPATVLGADTLVVLDGRILGKPADPDDARAMLALLRGRRHEVLTAVAAVDPRGGSAADLAVTGVWMRTYDDADMDAYVDSGDPLDKAGAYAIQHRGFHPVQRLEGSETNVIGLPLALVARLIRSLERDA